MSLTQICKRFSLISFHNNLLYHLRNNGVPKEFGVEGGVAPAATDRLLNAPILPTNDNQSPKSEDLKASFADKL